MAEHSISDYIRKQEQKGASKDAIAKALASSGWAHERINKELSSRYPIHSDTSSTVFLGPIDLLKRTLVLFRARWKVYTTLSLALPISYFAAALIIWVIFVVPGRALDAYGASFAIVGIVTFMLLMVMVSIVGAMALYTSVLKHMENVGVFQALQLTWNRIIPLLLTSILLGLIVGAGYLIFYIPGMLFSLWFMFALYIVIEKNISGMDALLLSREYVRGYGWAILYRVIVIGLLGILFTVPFGIIAALIEESAKADTSEILFFNATEAFSLLINIIPSIVIVPLTTISNYLIFNNIQSIKGKVSLPEKKNARVGFYALAVLGGVIVLGLIVLIGTLINFIGDENTNPWSQYPSLRWQVNEEVNIVGIQFKIKHYQVDNGKFPSSLDDLVPKYLSRSELKSIKKSEDVVEYYQLDGGKRHVLCITYKRASDDRHCVIDDFIKTYRLPEAPPAEFPYMRDKAKFEELKALQVTLARYAEDNNGIYPLMLKDLSPYFKLLYPRMGIDISPYTYHEYTRGDNGKSYQVCTEYEISEPSYQCIAESIEPQLDQGTFSQ